MTIKAEVGGHCLYPESELLMPSSDCVYAFLNYGGVTQRTKILSTKEILRNKETS